MQARYQIWQSPQTANDPGPYFERDEPPAKFVVLVRGDNAHAEIHLINDDFVLCLYDQKGEPLIHSEGIGTSAITSDRLLDRARDGIANYAVDRHKSGDYVRAANFAEKAREMAHDDREAELAWRLVRLRIEAELEIQDRKK